MSQELRDIEIMNWVILTLRLFRLIAEIMDTPLESIAQRVVKGSLRMPIKAFYLDHIVDAHMAMDEVTAAKIVVLVWQSKNAKQNKKPYLQRKRRGAIESRDSEKCKTTQSQEREGRPKYLTFISRCVCLRSDNLILSIAFR
jgi:hypothetical protein